MDARSTNSGLNGGTVAPGLLAHLDRATCLALLGTRPVGRLVFTHRALPDVLPVNYRMDGESLVIRLGSGSTAAAATRDTVVAFEVDDIDIDSRSGWSVTVVGHAHEITEPGELRHARSLDVVSWAGDGRDHFVSVAAERLTGRRLYHASDLVRPRRVGDDLITGID